MSNIVIVPQTRDELRTELQQSIRDAVRDARDAAREAAQAGREAAVAAREGVAAQASPALDVPTAMALLEAQVNAVNKEISDLTAQLTSDLSNARERAIEQQLSSAVERREELREQMDQLMVAGIPVVPQVEVFPEDVIPPQAVDIAIAFFVTCAVIAVGIPLARAFGRWLDRRGQVPASGADTDARLSRIEQAIEAVAIEVERVSEGQRYTNRAMSELRGLPAPNAEGWPSPARDRLGVERQP